MATINFVYRSNKNFAPLSVRFRGGRLANLYLSTHIVIPKKNWDPKKQKIKTTNDFPEASQLNEKLLQLEAHILSRYNNAFINGEDINHEWFRNAVLGFFNRPKFEIEKKKQEARETYLFDYANYFCEEVIGKGKWKDIKTKRPISTKSAVGYNTTLNLIQRFNQENKVNTKLKDVSVQWSENFSNWMASKDYRINYTNKNIGRVKFFCTRAEEEGIEVNKEYKSRSFSTPTEQTVSTYLNENELQKIYDYHFEDPKYDIVRDWLIIGSYTGLRVSDFLKRLRTDHIENGFINITTKKTGERVTIPIHSKVLAILAKRDGEFPKRYSDQKFNLYIKEACRLAGIDNDIYADIYDPETKRKKKGVAPKYLAISSHICRRSFATNHYGKLATSTIMAIGGWRTESSFVKYLRKSSAEHAIEMQRYWQIS